MSGAQELSPEMQFAVDRLIEKVFQGDERKRGLATNCVSVVFAAMQDHVPRTIGTLDDADWERPVDPELARINSDDIAGIRRLMALRLRNASVELMEDEI